MKKITKFTAVSMAAVLAAASLTACGSSTAPANTEKAAETTAASAESQAPAGDSGDKKFTVGICQLVQHEALDAATKGFKDALVEEFGDKVTFDGETYVAEAE